MSSRVDATVTFNPGADTVSAILDQLKRLNGTPVVADNSTDREAQELVLRECASRGIRLLPQRGNEGTGKALNRLLEFAKTTGATGLHYLDQDSQILSGYLETLMNYDGSPPSDDFVGAAYSARSSNDDPGLQPSKFVIASGTWFNIRSLDRIGGFDETFFLDLVDHEVCLRMRALGGTISIDWRREMSHPIGVDGVRVIGILVTRHPRWRRALMWTNTIILCKRYLGTFPWEMLRHLAVRILETLISSAYLKDPSYISAAVSGLRAGLRRKSSSCLRGWDRP